MSLPWVTQLVAIIESDVPINQKAAQALDLLKASGLAYVAKLKAKDILVHTSNRGGAMVNAFDVISKGEQICQVGCDLKKITPSVCVELPYEPTKRKAAIDANARLAEQSGGLSAKPFGQERYIKSIGNFVASFAGGESFNLLKYLDFISRQYGGSLMFGEDFTDFLANCDWKQDNTTFPMLRVALACCQVTSPKSSQKDGFAKLIVKSDFDKLKGKKLLPNLLKAEALMLAAWEAIQKSGLPVERIALPFGKLQVRLALWLLDKEMKGREATKYEDMKQIKDMFETELAACSTQQDSGAASASATSSSVSPGGPVKALELASDPKSIALAQHKHIKLNGLYIYKGGDKVFSFQEMKDDGALLLHAPYFGNTEEMLVKLADLKFLKEWKKPRPALIADDVRTQLLPSQSPMLEQEQATAQAQCALYEKYKESQGCMFFFAMSHSIF
eukprot:s1586_g7.t1